ncbi:MAG: FMN-binding protein [Flavobacteriales bacterium]|nr:FMN-binding protein [Flavobacteriales bacterium]
MLFNRVVPALLTGTLFLVLCANTAYGQWVPTDKMLSKAELTVQKQFNIDYSKSAIDLSPNYYELTTNDSIIGYMCLQQAPSKHDMFDFLAIYSRDMELLKLQILAYRENYGGEIANKRWLKQFLTRPSEKVQAISGATISVESMKMVVSSLNQKMKNWHQVHHITSK